MSIIDHDLQAEAVHADDFSGAKAAAAHQVQGYDLARVYGATNHPFEALETKETDKLFKFKKKLRLFELSKG